MAKKAFSTKFWLITGLCLLLIMQSANAFESGWRKSLPSKHEMVAVGHQRYHYYNGRFYRPALFGLGFFVVAAPIGAIVTVLPVGYTIIRVGGVTYYYYDNVYYTACPSGYVVVQAPPAAVGAPPAAAVGEMVINIPNSDGTYTPVKIVKHNSGYIGPQGEYYPQHPTVEQLKLLYGK
jgi:hypothetical protein